MERARRAVELELHGLVVLPRRNSCADGMRRRPFDSEKPHFISASQGHAG